MFKLISVFFCLSLSSFGAGFSERESFESKEIGPPRRLAKEFTFSSSSRSFRSFSGSRRGGSPSLKSPSSFRSLSPSGLLSPSIFKSPSSVRSKGRSSSLSPCNRLAVPEQTETIPPDQRERSSSAYASLQTHEIPQVEEELIEELAPAILKVIGFGSSKRPNNSNSPNNSQKYYDKNISVRQNWVRFELNSL